MKQLKCKTILLVLTVLAGLFASVFLFSGVALSEGDPAAVKAALQDLSVAVGQPVDSKEQAIALCDSEKYFEICAAIGKKHSLYAPEEIKQVDTFITEIRGVVAEQLKSCQTTECLINVANNLAKKVAAKDPKLAESFELTPALVEKKQAVITAAKEAGVDFDTCRNMDPDTAEINTLRACAKLAKDSRVKDIIPEKERAQREKYGDYVDKSVELRASLQSGEFQCGNGSLDGCGDFCLNPSEAARAQGSSVIPPVCRQIAQKFFGADGVKQLEAAYSQVNQVKDFYKKKSENILFTTIDGRTLTRPEEIGRYMEEQGGKGNVEAIEKGMDYMVAKGFVKPEEKEFALKFVKQVKDRGANIDFDQCRQNPESCREFIPEDHRGEFEAGIEIDQIMRQEIGFDPQECSKGEFDPTIGDKCFRGSKRALPKLEALATKSKEAAVIVAEIKGHLSRGEEFDKRKGEIERTFQQGGGPGGCRSEQECRNYCSDSSHGPECIAFGAKQGISGFRGEEAVQKFQEYNSSLQRPQYGSQGYPSPSGVFPGQGNQQGFPGQGYPVQGGFPGQGYPVQGGFPSGSGGYPIPGGFPSGGQAGPSPECFAAIKAGDYAKAKVVCESRPLITDPICPSLPTVNSCPVGEIKVVSYSSPNCGTYYSCQKEYRGEPSYSPYPTGGDGRYCPPPSYWDESIRGCRSGGSYSPSPSCPAGQYWEYRANTCKPNDYIPGGSYSPYPSYSPGTSVCSPELIKLLGEGCHWMNTNFYCDGPMTKSAKYGDTATTPGCSTGGGTYTPYPTVSGGTPQCADGKDNDNDGAIDYPKDTGCYGPDDWDEAYGASYSPYPSYSPGTSACSPELTKLLGEGCHWMNTNFYCDGPMTKSAKYGDTATTPGCSTGGGTYTPYPSGTYTPYPSGSPTSGGTCPSGSHLMYVNNAGGYCMSDADGTKCGPMNSSSTSSFTNSCSSYGGSSYSPYPTSSSTSTYSPSPTGVTSSCPSGSHSMGSHCMSDTNGSLCGPLGSSSTSGWGSCSAYQSSAPTYSYTPGSTYSYTPAPSCPSGQWWSSSTNSCQTNPTSSAAPSCPSGQWWDYATSSCKSTTFTYSPAPTYTTTYTSAPTSTYTYTPAPTYTATYTPAPTYTYTPAPTSTYTYTPYPSATYSPPPSCSSGQYWDEASHTCKTAFDSQRHQMAMARTIMACADSGGKWDNQAGACHSDGLAKAFFANLGKIFSRFIK